MTGNARWGLRTLPMITAVLALSGVSMGDSLSLPGTTVGGGIWNRPDANGSQAPDTLSSVGTAVPFQAQTFSVNESSDYDFLSLGISPVDWDNYLFLYRAPFDPNNPLNNVVVGNDDFPIVGRAGFNHVSLQAGVSYVAVLSGFLNADAGDYTLNIVNAVQDRVSGGEKGSVLFFSDVELKWNANGALTQDTFVQISNDNIAGVNVQMYFINGDPPLAAIPAGQPGGPERAHPGWNNIDNAIFLTANQPSYWSALTGQPGSSNPPPSTGPVSPFTVLDPGNPPGRPDLDPGAAPGSRYLRGFIIAFAMNAAGDPIVWNHLFGNATVVNYANGTAFEYNAWAFQAVNPALATGAVIGAAGAGVLNLNGVDYSPAFDLLFMNFQAVGATAFSSFASQVVSDSDLTLHLVNTDLRQNGTGPRKTKAKFDVWNQNEVKFSGAERCITCWEQRLLGAWAPLANHFTRPNLQTNVGKARINGERSDVVCPPAASSSWEPLLGVISTLLNFNGGQAYAEAGTNLDGMGFEPATIRYNVTPPPPPAQAPDSPEGWINLFQHQINKALNVGKN